MRGHSRARGAGWTRGTEDGFRGRWRIGGGALFAIACAVLFLILWGGVLIGRRVMVGGDVVYCCGPWSGTPGTHSIRNPLVGDGLDQFLPWFELIRRSFAAGRLPLWNPYVLFGAPLLGNGQASPFSPFTLVAVAISGAWGMSLAMLAKLWVAGTGMVVFLRRLRVGGVGAVLGGLSFATSSFMVVWLFGQNSSVAAWLPWVFAAVEWYIQVPRGRRLALLALAIGLQFLGGEPIASFDLCVGVALYGIVRCARRPNRAALPGLAAAGIVGVLVACLQLLPFASLVRQSGLVSSLHGANLAHLPITYVTSWLVPNLHGNPAIDGLQGRSPNYSESTGFAGVTALTLAVPGAVFQWKRDRSTMAALLIVGLVGAGIAYGVLTPVVGRLPGFESAPNERMLMLVCFVVACFGGIGIDGLIRRDAWRGWSTPGLAMSAVGLAALGTVVAGALLVPRLGPDVDSLGSPLPFGWITFWVALGAASLIGAAALAVAAWLGMRRMAVSGLAALALVEAAVFAGPFQPQLPRSQVLPHSAAMNWLVAHAGGRTIAAQGLDVPPETATLYGLHDARGYDHTVSPRVAIFWNHADRGYQGFPRSFLAHPGAQWLAAAGVKYFMTSGTGHLPGTVPAYHRDGVTISRVPRARPFAFAAPSVRRVGSAQQAAKGMASDPLGSVYLEGSGPQDAGQARVRVVSRQPGDVELDVNALQPAEVVVLQSYAPGWSATVDGRQTKIVPADVLFQAVRVPAGRHRVDLVYRPATVPLGFGLTGAGLVLIVLFFVFNPDLSRFGRSRKRARDPRLRSAG